MFRKRKNPTPGFRMPPPFQPMAGENAALRVDGTFPYSALVQVAAEDTHKNYVLCRGFDPRISKFIDYESGNSDKPGIPVAKPYGKRRIGAYQVAQVFMALLPLQTTNPSPASVDWRIRQNPGVSESDEGHPLTLDEKIDELYTAEGKLVNYMLVDAGDTGVMVLFSIDSVTVPECEIVGNVLGRPCGVLEVDEEVDGKITIYDSMCCVFNEPEDDLLGRVGWATRVELDPEYDECCAHPLSPECIWSVVTLCCPACVAPPVVPPSTSQSSGDEPAALITGSGPGPIPGMFLP